MEMREPMYCAYCGLKLTPDNFMDDCERTKKSDFHLWKTAEQLEKYRSEDRTI